MSKLYELGLKHNTDKTILSATHGMSYLHIYERLFASLDQYEEIRILEIGVRGGNSVNMWLERFPNAIVVGIDICDCDFEVLDPERFIFYKADQRDIPALKEIGLKHKSYDLIIDDGSHQIGDYIESFYALYPFLRRNGFYVIEDLYNNYAEWNRMRTTRINANGEAFDEFQNFITKNIHLSRAFNYKDTMLNIFSIHQYPGFMVVNKDLV
ncbi:class I SAM-dependent methyltransferase [Alteromonas sp. a30]|uniref:class I SAM-dependent methyltransferase n=1 Tax=Alteromonas sp. a30 TaxID=2730917 RepID=UPI00227FAD7C|nr:class I SAM-dependent methyltransferase [Alteromonas sp. a30]MCY7296213.1 hypothetical protein [Alteromonas sp. a30]